MKLSLVVLSEGKASGQSIPIKLSQFLIGRDPQCHLRPASPVISKRHCVVLVKKGKVFIRDFDSTNGTIVNDERIEGERELKNDDVIQLGPISFRVLMEGVIPVDKPTPLPAHRKDSSDDDIAALMLSEDGEASVATEDTAEAQIPSGTTIMDMPAVPTAADETETKKEEKPKETRGDKAKAQNANTATAAAAILAKYSRRPRS